MNLEQFFAAKIKDTPALAAEFAQAEAELRLAVQTAQHREQQGLTQRQLAERMGVAQAVVGRFERAGRTPGVDTLWRVPTALNVHFYIGPNFSVQVYNQQYAPGDAPALAEQSQALGVENAPRLNRQGLPHSPEIRTRKRKRAKAGSQAPALGTDRR